MDDQTIDPTLDPTALAAPGPVETQTQGTTSGSSQTVATPADRQAIAGQFDANMNAADQQRQVGDAEANRSTQIADVQGEDADLARQQAADAAADHQAYLDRIEKARGQQEAAEDALKDHKFHDFFANETTGHHALRTLGTLMNGMGGNVEAQKALNENLQAKVKQDFDQQRAEYAQKLDAAKIKGANVNDLYSQWSNELAASKVKEAKAHEAIAAKALEIGTRAGIPVDQLRNNVLVQTSIANAHKARLESQLHFDRTNRFDSTRTDSVTDGKGVKGPTKENRDVEAKLSALKDDVAAAGTDPATPQEIAEAVKRIKPAKDATGAGQEALQGAEKLFAHKFSPEAEARIARTMRLANLNALAGERKTPEADVAFTLSQIPTTKDKDDTRKQGLGKLLTSQLYKTSPAYAKAFGAPKPAPAPSATSPAPAPGATTPPSSPYSPDVLKQARAAMADPKAPSAVKIKAAAILDAAK